jgi:hypothetical protein
MEGNTIAIRTESLSAINAIIHGTSSSDLSINEKKILKEKTESKK